MRKVWEKKEMDWMEEKGSQGGNNDNNGTGGGVRGEMVWDRTGKEDR